MFLNLSSTLLAVALLYSFLIWPTVKPNASTFILSFCSDVIIFLICVGSTISNLLDGISTCKPKFLALSSEGLFVNSFESFNSLKDVTSCLSILYALKGAAIAIDWLFNSSASNFILKLCSCIILGLASHIGAWPFSAILFDVNCGINGKADILINVLPSAYTNFLEFNIAPFWTKPFSPNISSEVISSPLSILSNRAACIGVSFPNPNSVYLKPFVV